MVDLEPAISALVGVVQGVGDDQLERPTPCSESTVGALLDHVHGFALAFAAAAAKQDLPGDTPRPAAANLPADWRTAIPARLDGLLAAWREDGAWEGMTKVGGMELPAQIAGLVALDEVVVHGWDLAVATGQPYEVPVPAVLAALAFVEPTAANSPAGTPGLFGPPQPVDSGAAPMEKLLALTGRDPGWTAPPGG